MLIRTGYKSLLFLYKLKKKELHDIDSHIAIIMSAFDLTQVGLESTCHFVAVATIMLYK
jgi:hypothetical protein